MRTNRRPASAADSTPGSPWPTIVAAAAVLAAAIGVGRFVYTPLLPQMSAQAGLSPHLGAALATANYAGYFAGALAGVAAPALARSRAALRLCLAGIVVSLALMPVWDAPAGWLVLRAAAGAMSALCFVIAVNAILAAVAGRGAAMLGWGFAGAGAGIAVSGGVVSALRAAGDWRVSWWAAAALALALGAAGWRCRPGERRGTARAAGGARADVGAIVGSYTLEGVGYIIAGTFLVAAVERSVGGAAGDGAWVLVGLAEIPSAALWGWVALRRSRSQALAGALAVQSVGIGLPAVLGGVAPSLVSAALFGGTFIAVGALSMGIADEIGMPRAVAVLTAGYGAGQVAGPIVVSPLLDGGYRPALLVGSLVVGAAALASTVLLRGARSGPSGRAAGRVSLPGREETGPPLR